MRIGRFKFRISDIFKKYFLNTSWIILEKMSGSIIVFLISIYVARYLMPENFGKLSYIVSIAGFFSPFATLGLGQIVVRQLVSQNELRDTILGTAFILRMLTALFALAIIQGVISLRFIDPALGHYVLIAAAVFIFQAFCVIDFYFQSKVLSKYVVYVNFTVNIISSFLKILFIYMKMSFGYFVLLILFDSVIQSAGYIYIYLRRKLNIFNWNFSIAIAKEFLWHSWPIIFSGFSIIAYMSIDQIMLKSMAGIKAVGYYSAALKICEMWYAIPMLITGSIYPYIISLHADKDKYYGVLQLYFDFINQVALVIILIITVASPYIINLLYGRSYANSSGILSILILVLPFVFFSSAKAPWFVLENRLVYNSFYTFLGLISNILLNLMLIPPLREAGAALATIISQFLINIGFPLIVKKDRILVKMFFKSFSPVRLIHFVKDRIYVL